MVNQVLKNKLKSLGLSKIHREMVEDLQGQEIRSLRFAEVVGIKGNKIIGGGKVLKTIKTNKDVSDIWKEYIYDEYGTTDMKKIREIEGF